MLHHNGDVSFSGKFSKCQFKGFGYGLGSKARVNDEVGESTCAISASGSMILFQSLYPLCIVAGGGHATACRCYSRTAGVACGRGRR